MSESVEAASRVGADGKAESDGIVGNKRKELRYSIFRLRYIVATVDLYTTTYRSNLNIGMRKQMETDVTPAEASGSDVLVALGPVRG